MDEYTCNRIKNSPEETLKVMGKINNADSKILKLNKSLENNFLKKINVAIIGLGYHQLQAIQTLKKNLIYMVLIKI